MKTTTCLLMAAVASIILICGCTENNSINDTKPIGGDRDKHGCLGPAGYSWDADLGACIRTWELNSTQRKAAKLAIAPLSYPVTITGVDILECEGCFIIHLQRNDNQETIETRLKDWQVAPDTSLTEKEAIEIARNSVCASKQFVLTENVIYNPNSRTWWIDLIPNDPKPTCPNPACVVSEESKTAEVNWRCMGLIEPKNDEIKSFNDCVAAGYPVMESFPRQCSVPGGRTFTERVVSEEERSVVKANNGFAYDLYGKYKSDEGNIFFSPYSIENALAMTYEGAIGKTAEEMLSVLGFPGNENVRRTGFQSINNEMNKKDKSYNLSTANALWAQKDYSFRADYFSTTSNYYGGKVTNLDFAGDTENSRQTINRWVEEQTNNKIKDLIPAGGVDAMTRLVLTNAIYFKGNWLIQFNKNNTKERDFRVSPDRTVKAKMMNLAGEKAVFNYGETDKLQILELPYDGKELSMILLLPRGDDIKSFEDSLSAENLASWENSMEEKQVDVFLPSFKFETKYNMAKTLKEMGMPTAFSQAADFSGMTGKKDLFISEVIHQAYVDVNEEGTEAAAATAVIMSNTAIMEPPKIPVFNADHPFIFLIQDKASGNILFMGRVSDPTA
jgi:serpin B